ncbi:MFS monocarboxylate transporter [Annulohypoxylon maeteangense]|uniref:MFS monocarboxylate transporter n=1 Tax=Annulohypoxylon maeteangense TaxID=1927788 RepID=UPI00200842B8|nr:MFS monocarboxylate transporter [Annulohypoxylon maeteangense]KAI0881989.1 MFS monocarboxylate transporter [Annulohypoxylon maeteangense]
MDIQQRVLGDESNLELIEIGQLEDDQPTNTAHAYPPDRGKHAWLFLWVGCFLMIALTWGFPFSYGVFQSYYSTHPPFSDHPEGLPAVGTTALGTLYLTSPPSFIILQRYQSHRRLALIVGSVVTCLAVLASAFATKVWHLLLTQGILYGLGASVVNTVTIQFLNEWFIERKGLAFGIQEAGAAMGGVVIPVLMTWGLDKYGHRNILIAWFLAITILSLPSIYFLRERVRPRAADASEIGTLGFVATPIFLLLQAGNIFQALGNFLPGIHLPSFALRFGASPLAAAGMLSFYNVASVIGAIGTGYLVDRYHVSVTLFLLSLGAAVAVFFAWGFAGNFATLCGFAFIYGMFAGGWSSTWVGIGLEIQKRSPHADLGVLWGFAAAARGVGSIASGPISERLIAEGVGKTSWWPKNYGSNYGVLILFNGIMLVLGSVGCTARIVEILKRVGHRHND